MIDLNSRIDDNDPCWLVKVDTRIDGPFSFNDVLSKLTSGELFSHNEVMAPLDRWRTLQSHPLFAAAVEKLRRQKNSAPENAMNPNERTQLTRTHDLSFETMTPALTKDMTPTPPPTPLSVAQKTFVDLQRQNQPPVTPPIYVPQDKKSNTVTVLIIFSAFIFAACVVFILFSKSSKSSSLKVDSQQSSMANFFDKGFYHKKRGEWTEALRNFRQAQNINPKDHYTVFELAPLLVQVENQYIYARSILEKILGTRFSPEDICLSANANGLAYSYEGSPDKKNYQKAILKYDECLNQNNDEGVPSETMALTKLNKGFTLMLAGQYDDAEAVLTSSKISQQSSMAPYLFIIENYLYKGYYKNNRAAYVKAFNLASQISKRPFYDGHQEILLFQAFAAYKLGKEASYVSQTLEKALNIDPDLTTEHYHSPAMDWRVFNWKYFEFICNDFRNFSKPDLVSWLSFTCSYKMNNEIEAQQVLGGWWNRSQSKSTASHVAQSVLFYRFGELEKAKDSLSSKLIKTPNALYFQILSKICIQQKDNLCLEQNLTRLSKVSKLHAEIVKMNLGSVTEREQAFRSGLLESKNYLPLLRAKK